jgi:hypothetical protein
MPYGSGDIYSSRPIQYEERATIDTRTLFWICVIAVFFLWCGWKLTQLPPGAVWWQAY